MPRRVQAVDDVEAASARGGQSVAVTSESICKAMLASGITADFVIVDGSEGGTGAAPVEFEDHVGMPLTEGLMLVHNSLVGTGLRGPGTRWRPGRSPAASTSSAASSRAPTSPCRRGR